MLCASTRKLDLDLDVDQVEDLDLVRHAGPLSQPGSRTAIIEPPLETVNSSQGARAARPPTSFSPAHIPHRDPRSNPALAGNSRNLVVERTTLDSSSADSLGETEMRYEAPRIVVPELVQVAETTSWPVLREWATDSLAKLEAPEAVPFLIDDLRPQTGQEKMAIRRWGRRFHWSERAAARSLSPSGRGTR
jgi:hypothetical protein